MLTPMGDPFVIEPEQGDDLIHVARFIDLATYPARRRKYVVRQCATFHNQLIAYLLRKRKVCESVAVQMSEFDLAKAELDSAETVEMRTHSVPAENDLLNLAARSLHEIRQHHGRRKIPLQLGRHLPG